MCFAEDHCAHFSEVLLLTMTRAARSVAGNRAVGALQGQQLGDRRI
jgi:hypothetical protein